MELLIWLLILWNVITFMMMGIDKHRAKADKTRISEKTLLLSSFIMGGVGTCAGAAVFHHKTQKIKFKILLPVSVVVNAAVIYGLFYFNII